MITWVLQRVSYRVLWHSVHLPLSLWVCGSMDGGGHTANRALLASLSVLDLPRDNRGARQRGPNKNQLN
ncbi:hypothetical protein D8674_033097 [Pyrus ussuriensis x Pyrus communis]|uniref:Uncharacterized protein n=1 Tax=Pyrus ussuriensis x Pyrus communis TaxID=2448454 RepID=A0A5N5HQ96_9ROSA|nr:hypothetical protein D8674_033097 [Pyrus ussuriensis x Pyrus communis]